MAREQRDLLERIYLLAIFLVSRVVAEISELSHYRFAAPLCQLARRPWSDSSAACES